MFRTIIFCPYAKYRLKKSCVSVTSPRHTKERWGKILVAAVCHVTSCANEEERKGSEDTYHTRYHTNIISVQLRFTVGEIPELLGLAASSENS